MPLPAQLTVVTVHGRYLKPDGTPDTGTVTFAPTVPALQVPAADAIVTPTRVEKTLDANGEFTTTLIATDDPDATPTGWTYQVAERTSTLVRQRLITVPAATVGTLELADIADAVPGPANVAYALASVIPGLMALAGNNNVDLTADLALGFADINIDYANPTPDALTFRYLGARTGYHNEFGEVRGVAAKDTTVAARFRRKSAAATANIFEAADENNVPFVYVEADGDLRTPNLEPAAWQDPVFEANAGAANAEAGRTFDSAQGRRESAQSGVARLKGTIGVTGAFNSGVPFATLPGGATGLRPAASRCQIIRTTAPGGGTSTQARLTVDPDGTMHLNANITSGTNIHLDGVTYTL